MREFSSYLNDQDVDRLDDQKFIKKSSYLIPRLPNFFTEVLYAIQTIRSRRGRGGTIGEICSFMKKKFGSSGDIRSRVVTTIAKAKRDGFCMEKCGIHIPVTPLARLQNAKTRTEKNAIIKRMQTIFLYKANMRKRRGRARHRNELHRTVSTAMSPKRRQTMAKAEMVSVLKHIESVLMKHLVLGDADDDDGPQEGPQNAVKKQTLKKSDLHINQLLFQSNQKGRGENLDGSEESSDRCMKRRKGHAEDSDDSKDRKHSHNSRDHPHRSKYELRSRPCNGNRG